MPKPPTLRPKEIEAILLRAGFIVKRQTGSHRIFHHLASGAIAVVPFHSKVVPPGTMRSIIKQSGLAEADFR